METRKIQCNKFNMLCFTCDNQSSVINRIEESIETILHHQSMLSLES